MSATLTVPPDDLLFRLTRLLLATPEDALNAPPISRRTLAAIVSEIKLLRQQLAERDSARNPAPAASDAEIIARISAAGLPAQVYRTARVLLDMAGKSGNLKISRHALQTICQTTADGTVRRHLSALSAAGILHHSTRGDYHYILFGAWSTADTGSAAPAAPKN